MFVSPKLAVRIVVALLAAIALPARADDRAQLNACQAMVDRAARAAPNANGAKQDDAELQRCRQIVREWTLRDSRMSVDEQGRPLR
jgi:hypothetical protein